MQHVVMTIRGTVCVTEDRRDHPWKYRTNVRPSAKTLDGLTASEVVLDDPDGEIGSNPQLATLEFPLVVKFETNVAEIELYDGSRLVMLFRPLTLDP